MAYSRPRSGSTEPSPPAPLARPGRHPVFLAQVGIVMAQAWRQRINQPLLIVLPVLVTLIFSLLVAFTWFQLAYAPTSARAYHRVFSLQAFFHTTIVVVGSCTALAADRREILPRAGQRRGFSPGAVWLGRYVADLPLRILLILLSSLLIYPLCKLRPGVQYFLLYQLALSVQAAGNTALGMCCSAATSTPLVAVWLAFLAISFNYLFSAVAYTPRQMTWILRWLRFLSSSFYSVQTLIFSQFHGATYPGYVVTGDAILQATGWLKIPLAIAILGGFWMILLYTMIGVSALYATSRR